MDLQLLEGFSFSVYPAGGKDLPDELILRERYIKSQISKWCEVHGVWMVERVYLTLDFVFNASNGFKFAKSGFDFWKEVFECFKVCVDSLGPFWWPLNFCARFISGVQCYGFAKKALNRS